MSNWTNRLDAWFLNVIDGISSDLQRKGIVYPLLIMIIWAIMMSLMMVSTLHMSFRMPTFAWPNVIFMTFVISFGTYLMMPFYWRAYRRWDAKHFAICSISAINMRQKYGWFRIAYVTLIIFVALMHIAVSYPEDQWLLVRISENFLGMFPVFLFHLFGCSFPLMPVKDRKSEERPETEGVTAQ